MDNLSKTAASATLHCLTGCAIGEVAGMVISSALNWNVAFSITLSILLAFLFGYLFSMHLLTARGLGLKKALKIALAADTTSIAIMELVDNGFIMLVPGAIHAGLDTLLFWGSLMLSLVAAFIAAFPLNRYLIARGRGHAVAHNYHSH